MRLQSAAPAAILLAAFAAAPASALAPQEAITAERAMELQKDTVRDVIGTLPCRRGSAAGDIVVCGRRGESRNRPPLPFEPVPGERENLLPGELPRAETSFSTCEFGCPQPVTVTDKDVRKYGGRILRKVLGKD